MDQEIRNKLRNVVTQCRKLLEEAISQELEGKYGIFAKKDQVTADPNAKMTHLSEEEQEARRDILDHYAHIKARGFKPKDALDQLIREIAFTHLNRLCAYKMMEAREVYVGGQKFREAVSRGVNSNGVKFYLAEHPDDERLSNTGQQDVAYRHFLDWLGGALSDEIGVLFNPNDPANRLYPRQKTLDDVLDLLNGGGIKAEETELREQWPQIWSQDETIGWVYQYFTPIEMRRKARSESRSPRNSYELAFRNQFFTPRYVVEFLTDNTLGRIWYEMRKGDTKLKDQCRYMVRRPTEIFLKQGEQPPKDAAEGTDDLSQEELLKLPVHIPHRPKKDPRELKILDPACGSGHFLLYCFDLLLTIYEEAYADPDLSPALKKDYPTLDALKRDVPRLILAHNLHGIDIDLRASQIAALALWLRCQRAYQDMGLKKDRPQITRSNFVCAEPMPGEEQMLKEFVGQLEPKVLGQVVEVVFDKMKLAGEAGSLLKIEEEIRDAVASAKKQYVRETTQATDRKGQPLLFTQAAMDRLAGKPDQPSLFDLSDITDNQFFEQAESRVIETLRSYAEKAHNGQRLQRRLFTDDAVRGFAFVDLCQKRHDVVLMNPPFGELNVCAKSYLFAEYENSHLDILTTFIERVSHLCCDDGLIGAITNRTCFYLTTLTNYRKEVLAKLVEFEVFLDLGEGVLDAVVEPAAFVLRNTRQSRRHVPFIRLLVEPNKGAVALDEIAAVNSGRASNRVYYSDPSDFARLSSSPFCYWVPRSAISTLSQLPPIEGNAARIKVGLQTGDDWRFLRFVWEVDPHTISPVPRSERGHYNVVSNCVDDFLHTHRWAFYSKTDVASPWYSPITLLVDWKHNGHDIKNFTNEKGQKRSRHRNEEFYFRPGFSFMLRSTRIVPYVIPPGVIPTAGRSQVYPEQGKEIDVLGVCASRLGSSVARFGGEKFAWPKFQASMVQAIPAVPVQASTREELEQSINAVLEIKRRLLSHFEPWQDFAVPALLIEDEELSDEWQLSTLIGDELEEAIADDAGLSRHDLDAVCQDLLEAIAFRTGKVSTPSPELDDEEEEDDEEAGESESISLVDRSARSLHAGFMSYCVGVIFGRWDVRMAKDRTLAPKPQQLLDPIPPCPPGTLVSPDGYPARGGEIVSEEWLRSRPDAFHLPATSDRGSAVIADNEYPIGVQWDGLLVDDPDHPGDITKRIQGIYEYVWGGRSEAVEKETCEVLEVGALSDFLHKSGKGGFWQHHLATYKGSKRPSAPVYWLLQSSKKNYGLWIYYHRLNKDILFRALQPTGPVQTKFNIVQTRLDELRRKREQAGDSGREAKRIGKDIETQEEFLSELRDFEDKLRRAANLRLEPDLNDGVVLNIAPLWELVPWKEAKSYWDELMEGQYEWSSIGKQLRQKGLVK